MEIPKNIILIQPNPPPEKLDIITSVISKYLELNPEYTVILFDEGRMAKFLEEFYSTKYTNLFHKLTLRCLKRDFFRYCYLYKKGGCCIDWETNLILPLREFIEANTDFLAILAGPRGSRIDTSIILSLPHNPILKRCISDFFRYDCDLLEPLLEVNYANISLYNNLRRFVKLEPRAGITIGFGIQIQLGEVKPIGKKLFFWYDQKKIAYLKS